MTLKKAKRKLSDIDFSVEGAHLALTHKNQNYSANGHPKALILKARSQEFIQKIQQIQVTLELPEFLRRFYDMYWDDADMLSRLLGYVPPESEDDYDWKEEQEKYIAEKLQAYTVIKSLKDSSNIAKSIAELPEDDLLKVLESQAKMEPLMLKAKEDTSRIGTEVEENEVSTSVVKQAQNKDSVMTDKNKQEQNVEMVEKSALVALQKSLDEAKLALEKANATIAQYEAKEKEAVVKARTAALEAVVDADKLETVKKAVMGLEDADFDSMIAVFKSQKEAIEKAKEGLFVEQGASGEGQEEVATESPVAKLIKQKHPHLFQK